jgi:hypothetical protein
MPRSRSLLAALALALAACLGTAAAAPARTGAAPAAAPAPSRAAVAAAQDAAGDELAMAAGAFVDSIGVNARPADAAAGWALADRLRAAGIGHVRGVATGPDDPALAGLRALAGAELQLDLVAGADADPAVVADLAASLGAAVAAVEAPAGRAAAPLRRAVRGHPRLPGVAVLGQGLGADYQAVRLDLGGRCPGCVPDQLGSGDAAVQVTEVALGTGVPEAVAARYLLRLLLANAGLAVRTYLDAHGSPERGPGLLDAAGAPTPAYHAVARLVALLADRRQVEPGRLAYRLSGSTEGVRHRLLQKSDGHFWLALWVERPGWDPAAGQELAVPAQPVRVSLARPVAGARAFVPELGTGPERSFAAPDGALAAVDLEVSDRVLLLELLPRRAGGAPTRATAPPAEPLVPSSLDQPPAVVAAAGQPAPPTTAPAGAAAPAAAARQPEPALDPASRSPLAFTGATAVSMLVASALLMLVGVAALFASRRRYHHRH